MPVRTRTSTIGAGVSVPSPSRPGLPDDEGAEPAAAPGRDYGGDPSRRLEPFARRQAARRRRRSLYRLALDLVVLVAASAAAAIAGRPHEGVGPWGWIVLYAGLTTIVIAARGGYRFRLEVSPFEYMGQVIAGTATAAMLVITTRILIDPEPELAAQVVRVWGFATVYLVAARLAVAFGRGTRNLNTLIIGAGDVGRTVARRLSERPQMGLSPVGFLDKQPLASDDVIPVLGTSHDLERVVLEHDVEHVIVAFSTAPHDVLLGIVRRSRALGIEVSLVPRLFEEISKRVAIEHLGGIALVRVERPDPRGWQFEVKYAVDRALGGLLLVLSAPVMIATAALVKLSSPGPVFFRQGRVGLDGREFDILKFRTMHVIEGAPEHDAAWAARVVSPALLAAERSDTADRRTRPGHFLRRSSLDELPQLVNVVKGDMSLVGPRPERTGYARDFERHVHRYGDRHRVKSGLTGWAQVHGLRGETSLRERVEWDNYYVENWSPMLDVKILLLTLPAIIRGAKPPASPGGPTES